VGVLNICDIMFAHNIATRKRRVLKVTLQVATSGAESAVYDCLGCENTYYGRYRPTCCACCLTGRAVQSSLSRFFWLWRRRGSAIDRWVETIHIPDMELGHWVTGSVGHLGVIFHVRVTESPGHHFDPA